MPTKPEAVPLLCGSALAVACVVLTGLGHAVPSPLWVLVSALVAGGLGITNPLASTSSSSPTVPSASTGSTTSLAVTAPTPATSGTAPAETPAVLASVTAS